MFDSELHVPVIDNVSCLFMYFWSYHEIDQATIVEVEGRKSYMLGENNFAFWFSSSMQF